MELPTLSLRLADPTFLAVREPLALLLDSAPAIDVAALDRVLGPLAGVRFERQLGARKRGEPFCSAASYDGSIATRAVVPSRAGSLHDVMNALAWAAFPRSKRAIHARQYAALTREVGEGQTALPGRRSRLRDRLSMLDEGGVIVWASAAPERVEAALEAASREEILRLVEDRALHARVLGHAILEHVARGDGSPVRGCVVLVSGPCPAQSDVDEALGAALDRADGAIEAWVARFPSIEVGWLMPA